MKYLKSIIFISLLLLIGCQKREPTSTNHIDISMVQNIGSYVSYVDEKAGNQFIMNLAFNHMENRQIDPKDVSIEFLPHTDIVGMDGFRIRENPPQKNLNQKALYVDFTSKKPGKHTFTQVAITYKGEQKTYPLGEISVDVKKGHLSGVSVLTDGAGIFPHKVPLSLRIRNDENYPVIIKDVLLSNPNIPFDQSDMKVGDKPLPKEGYLLKPNETVPLQVDWRVNFPANQIRNIEARPLLMTEHNGIQEFAGIPNMVFRNDFE